MAANIKPHNISTAACLVIGDEVLNGKIKDTNSNYFAKYCFELGIDMRRVAVVPDEEEDIVSVLNDLKKYDFVITSGGIGPTHDDITYQAVAKSYNLPLELDAETEDKMNIMATKKPKDCPEDVQKAQLRMATLPAGPNVSKYFVTDDLWVPIVGIDHRVYVLPGIPQLFTRLLESLKPQLLPRIGSRILQRRYVSTQTPESAMAKVLGDIQLKYKDRGFKIGSYPHMAEKRNTVSIIGPEEESDFEDIVQEVVTGVEGHEITAEEEAKSSGVA